MQKGAMFLLENIDPENIFTPEDFTDEHKMIADTVADFVENEILPNIEELDHQKEGLMRSMLEKAGELGLLSADIPEEYEGGEMGKIAAAIITENVSLGGSFAVSHGAHTGIGSLPIILFGNEEQKKKYLPGLATGKLVAAYALTEPMAGSDALGARTKAVLSEDGKYYILNGEKIFITNAGFADVFVTYAKIDGDKFTAFIVDRGTPGFTVGAEEKKLGIKGSSTCSLVFEDAKVPVENLLGEIGKGHVIAFNILNIGRYKLGVGGVGSAKGALAVAAKYALERQQFGLPIAKFGMIKNKIAQMAAKTYASESLVYRLVGEIEEALENKTDGREIGAAIEDYAIECSIAKVHASETLDYVVDECVQIHGGYGYTQEFPAERFYRDARINRIFEGTNEVNRLIIPATLLRRGMKGQLPLLQAAQALAGEVTSLRAKAPTGDEAPLEIEFDMVDRAKKLFLMVGGTAAQKFMQKIAKEQEIIEIMANMAIEIYAMESALLRAKKALNQDPENAETKVELALAYVYDAFPKLDAWAKQALTYMFEPGDMLRTNLSIAKRLAKYHPINLIGVRQKIAAKVLDAGKYAV
ncbi:acyl-CoA dehydrogenase family protein [Desulfallas sp. Bu1-1]|uniref:acyl-CoA dehydrogenase family protein n=1 Tax=Desulfallas sp. Bu1-1 TaxID=2787620 RepID=UPI00189D9357|nr:acyl-CoA dehydrogenase family protein [Desulfallas sp. Bu1-1]MBF7083470.1 acyl-CoA dehydrogenase family protein [Desulfallas sp. Bu1-1]